MTKTINGMPKGKILPQMEKWMDSNDMKAVLMSLAEITYHDMAIIGEVMAGPATGFAVIVNGVGIIAVRLGIRKTAVPSIGWIFQDCWLNHRMSICPVIKLREIVSIAESDNILTKERHKDSSLKRMQHI